MPAVDGGGGARAVHVPRVRRRRLLAVLLLPGKCFEIHLRVGIEITRNIEISERVTMSSTF